MLGCRAVEAVGNDVATLAHVDETHDSGSSSLVSAALVLGLALTVVLLVKLLR